MIRPGLTRFILATLVILYHINQNIFLGTFAVGCFFILSGYWISAMFQTKYAKKRKSLKVFYISRIWRLLPVFYTCTCLLLLVQIIYNPHFLFFFLSLNIADQIHFLFANMLILGYSTSGVQLLPPAWSLDIEMQFYLIYPLLMYIFKKGILLIILTVILACITMYTWVINPAMQLMPSLPYLSCLSYLFLFFIGVLIYHYKIRCNIKVVNLTSIFLLLIIAIQYFIPSAAQYYRNDHSSYYSILTLLLILCAIPILINSVHNETNATDKLLGEMSFMLYLSHWIWIVPYHNFVMTDPLHLITIGSKFGRLPYALAFLVVTLISSYLIYLLVDRPSEKLRHNWLKKQL